MCNVCHAYGMYAMLMGMLYMGGELMAREDAGIVRLKLISHEHQCIVMISAYHRCLVLLLSYKCSLCNTARNAQDRLESVGNQPARRNEHMMQ